MPDKPILIAALVVLLGIGLWGKTKNLFVPPKCMHSIHFTKPCGTLSDSLIKCDGVLFEISCVSPKDSPPETIRLEVKQ